MDMGEGVIEIGPRRGGNANPLGRRRSVRRGARMRLAGNRQRVERSYMRCERPEEAIAIVALEHAEDEVQWPVEPALGRDTRKRLARRLIVRAVEPQLPVGGKAA